MPKFSPRRNELFQVSRYELPDGLKKHIAVGVQKIKSDRDTSYPNSNWGSDELMVIEGNNPMIQQGGGDYSITYISFFKLRKGGGVSIPVLDKLSVDRRLTQDAKGLLKFFGLTDRWALPPEDDESKLAAGHFRVNLERNEVMVQYVTTYNSSFIVLYIGFESPLKIYEGYNMYSDLTVREYIGLRLLYKSFKNRRREWKLSDAWRHFFNEWSKSEVTVKLLEGKGYLRFKKEGFPSITSKGKAHLENLIDNVNFVSLQFNGRVSDILKMDLNINWNAELDSKLMDVLEEYYGLD
tara:strand:- start:286 stop:1170 length:885 start_codon:yes stop_codon:yes gene_type:complete